MEYFVILKPKVSLQNVYRGEQPRLPDNLEAWLAAKQYHPWEVWSGIRSIDSRWDRQTYFFRGFARKSYLGTVMDESDTLSILRTWPDSVQDVIA
jgi:hypothetical protein